MYFHTTYLSHVQHKRKHALNFKVPFILTAKKKGTCENNLRKQLNSDRNWKIRRVSTAGRNSWRKSLVPGPIANSAEYITDEGMERKLGAF